MFIKISLQTDKDMPSQSRLLGKFADYIVYGKIPRSKLNIGTIEKAANLNQQEQTLHKLIHTKYTDATEADFDQLIKIIKMAWASFCEAEKLDNLGYGRNFFQRHFSVKPIKTITESTLKKSSTIIIPKAQGAKWIAG